MSEPIEKIVERIEASMAIEEDHERLVCLSIDTVSALIASWRERAAALAEAVEAITPPWNEKKEAAVKRARAALAAAGQGSGE